MSKYLPRITWYVGLPLLAWLAMIAMPEPNARGILNVLVGYIPLSITWSLWAHFIGDDMWDKNLFGLSTQRMITISALLAICGFPVALMLGSELLSAASSIFALASIDGWIIERERANRKKSGK